MPKRAFYFCVRYEGRFEAFATQLQGSAGCIDLTNEMPGFADWFKNNGKDLIIKVEY